MEIEEWAYGQIEMVDGESCDGDCVMYLMEWSETTNKLMTEFKLEDVNDI